MSNCDFDGCRFDPCYLPINKSKNIWLIIFNKFSINKISKKGSNYVEYYKNFTAHTLVNWILSNSDFYASISNLLNNKNLFKKNIIITNYIRLLSRNHTNYNSISFYNANDSLLLIFDAKGPQLRVSILSNNRLLKTITSGYVLRLNEKFSKGLKKRLDSSILTVKFVNIIVTKFLRKKSIIICFKGINAAFSRLLLFIRKNISSIKHSVFYFIPSINFGYERVKKIKAIKRRMKKKYIYNSIN